MNHGPISSSLLLKNKKDERLKGEAEEEDEDRTNP